MRICLFYTTRGKRTQGDYFAVRRISRALDVALWSTASALAAWWQVSQGKLAAIRHVCRGYAQLFRQLAATAFGTDWFIFASDEQFAVGATLVASVFENWHNARPELSA